MCHYVEKLNELEKGLEKLIDDWKDELDARVPDKNAWVPEEEAESFQQFMEQAKHERKYWIYWIIIYHCEIIHFFRRISIYY